eukprot:m.35831 g.35831  ORF g.35831 m.35831 type:complete len:407 (+) comp12812_c0_seq2:187-1407(+)
MWLQFIGLVSAMVVLLGPMRASAQRVVPPVWSRTRSPNGWVYKGEQRQYHVLNPRGPMKRGSVPVIIAYHGNGADAAAFALQLPVLVEEGRARGYMLVFPEGIQQEGSQLRCKERSWNAGSCCGDAVLNDVDDIGFTHAVLDDLLRTYPAVDPRQIFITGSSNGGSMAVRVACEMPERVAAVGPEIGSLEAVDGNRCADRCVPEGDGVYEMCEWNNQLPDCAPTVFLKTLPGVFSCNRLKEHPTPMLFFNGNLDPYSNISGLIERPIKPGNATLYSSTFPSMDAAILGLRTASGCTNHKSVVSFQNGTKGNATTCTTFPIDAGCTANFTYCLSDAGHRWYGSAYDQYQLCLWEGYSEEECNPIEDLETYGPNTLSISVALQLLDFFDVHRRPLTTPTQSVDPVVPI